MDFGARINFILVPVNILFAIYFKNQASYIAAGICFVLGCICYINSL